MAQPGRSITEYMALVAIVAFDCVAIRLLLHFANAARDFSELVFIGILPMANVLAIGSLPLLRSHRGGKLHPFQAGFLGFGGSALLLLCLVVLLIPGVTHKSVDALIAPFTMPSQPKLHIVLPLFLLPQLGFALLGGWLHSRFRTSIQIDRRPVAGETEPTAAPRVIHRVTIQFERRPNAGEAEPAADPQVVVLGSPP